MIARRFGINASLAEDLFLACASLDNEWGSQAFTIKAVLPSPDVFPYPGDEGAIRRSWRGSRHGNNNNANLVKLAKRQQAYTGVKPLSIPLLEKKELSLSFVLVGRS